MKNSILPARMRIMRVRNESQGKTYSAEIATLVNGACHEFGVVENPEFLKDWNGFRNAFIH